MGPITLLRDCPSVPWAWNIFLHGSHVQGIAWLFFFFIRRNFSPFWVCSELPHTVKACASHDTCPLPPEYLSPVGRNQVFACISYWKRLAGRGRPVHPADANLTVSLLCVNTSCYNQYLVYESSLVTPNP